MRVLAATAAVHPTTARRWLLGAAVRSTCAARLEDAARALGMVPAARTVGMVPTAPHAANILAISDAGTTLR